MTRSWCFQAHLPSRGARDGLGASAYRRCVQDGALIRRRKRRSNVCVVGGVALMAVAVLVSWLDVAPLLVTTVGAIAGFVGVSYGVHVGWLVFYEREPDGPAS